MRLAGKRALVTGAGAGIGRATAELFAREGAAVAAVDRDETTARETASRIAAAGGRAIAIRADVSVEADVSSMLREAAAEFGGLDILFNNAGIVKQGRVEDSTLEDWNEQMATTLTSVFLGCKYGVPILRAAGGGVILNMASVAGIMGIANRAVYSAAKGGVMALTRAVAADYASEGIRVVALNPATIETPSLRDRIESSPDPAAARKAFEQRQPLGRIGKPDDVAYAALYLVSDEASFLTGSSIEVDGGMAL